MVQNLEGMGFTVVPFGQGFRDLSGPIEGTNASYAWQATGSRRASGAPLDDG